MKNTLAQTVVKNVAITVALALASVSAVNAGNVSINIGTSAISIAEGSSVTISPTVSYFGTGYYNSRYYYSGTNSLGQWYDYGGYYASDSYLNSLSGTLSINGPANSVSSRPLYFTNSSMSYVAVDEGTISLTASGSVREAQNYNSTWGWGHYETYTYTESCWNLFELFSCERTGTRWVSNFGGSQGANDWINNFSFTKYINVYNVAPTITSSGTDYQSYFTGDEVKFSATAIDPGVTDVLRMDWDLDNDGLYDDFTGASGTWRFNNAGTYHVKVRVSDGDGGFDYRDNIVQVSDVLVIPLPDPQTPSNVPEPGSMALLGLALAGLAVMRRQQFSLATGLRQSNVLKLEWSQINLEQRHAWIHVWQSKNRRPIVIPLA